MGRLEWLGQGGPQGLRYAGRRLGFSKGTGEPREDLELGREGCPGPSLRLNHGKEWGREGSCSDFTRLWGSWARRGNVVRGQGRRGTAAAPVTNMVHSLGPRACNRALHPAGQREREGRKDRGREEDPTDLEEIPKDCSRNTLATPHLELVQDPGSPAMPPVCQAPSFWEHSQALTTPTPGHAPSPGCS